MKTDIVKIEGNADPAHRLRRSIRSNWPRVTEQDLEGAAGDLDRVAELIEARYGQELESPPAGELSRMCAALEREDQAPAEPASASASVFRTWHPDTYDKRRA